jgi:hypothetical protein
VPGENKPSFGLVLGWAAFCGVVGGMFVHTAFFLKR